MASNTFESPSEYITRNKNESSITIGFGKCWTSLKTGAVEHSLNFLIDLY